MVVLKLAWRNLISGGLRTWLNLFVLSLTLGSILFIRALNDGTLEQMIQARTAQEIGAGQVWHQAYDPLDPLSIEEAMGPLSPELKQEVASGRAESVLVLLGTAYPRGRMRQTLLKGIDPNQQVLKLPFEQLGGQASADLTPVLLGRRMAERMQVETGTVFTVRWRSAQGAFNARDVVVRSVFETDVPAMDLGQIWFRYEDLEQMNRTQDFATYLVLGQSARLEAPGPQWTFKSAEALMKDTRDLMQSKNVGQSIFFLLLLFLSLIAIFDSQALAIFRRRREVGVLMALGLSRRRILAVFVLEGVLLGVLASVLTVIWGLPVAWYYATEGLSFGFSGEDYGMALGNLIYPYFDPQVVVAVFGFVNLAIAVVSFLPVRKILRLSPSNAIRGSWV